MKELEPKVFVTALGAYNAGHLHGRWSEAAVDEGVLWDDVADVLRTSPEPGDEEFFWSDHEDFCGYRLHEYETVANTVKIAKAIKEHGKPFVIWALYSGGIEEALESFEQAYIGCFDSEQALGQHLYEEYGFEDMIERCHKDIPESLHPYVTFDVEQYIFDMQANGELLIHSDETGVYGFNSCV